MKKPPDVAAPEGKDRRAGEYLRDMPKAKGAREPGTERGTRSEGETASYASQGIDRRIAARCQKIAATLKLRAERRAGELIRDMPKAKGIRMDGPRRSEDTTTETYASQGIDKRIAARCQKIAATLKLRAERRAPCDHYKTISGAADISADIIVVTSGHTPKGKRANVLY
jgi:hypothetical protein